MSFLDLPIQKPSLSTIDRIEDCLVSCRLIVHAASSFTCYVLCMITLRADAVSISSVEFLSAQSTDLQPIHILRLRVDLKQMSSDINVSPICICNSMSLHTASTDTIDRKFDLHLEGWWTRHCLICVRLQVFNNNRLIGWLASYTFYSGMQWLQSSVNWTLDGCVNYR